ncbi:MAG: HAD family hydrolase [Acholeplasmataceae bacterium]|nr:HAD family hydrolase [Acholeplasmataceae bacterium]
MNKAIIFDMDGTILNTIDDIRNSINHALTLMHMPTHDTEQVKMAVSSAARTFITRMVPQGTSDDDMEKTYQLFQNHYDQNNVVLTRPYEGIVALLGRLKDKGLKLAVVSNKYEYLVTDLNNQMFEGLFDAAVGVTDDLPIKPAPDMVHKALQMLGIKTDDAVYIGDSDIDCTTAHNSGLRMIGVTWGFRPEQTLIDHGAHEIVHTVDELETILDRRIALWQ